MRGIKKRGKEWKNSERIREDWKKGLFKKGGAVQKMRKLATQGTQWSGEGNEKIWIELDEEGG